MEMLLYWIIEDVDREGGAVRVLLVEDETRLAETVTTRRRAPATLSPARAVRHGTRFSSDLSAPRRL
jgi:hypothetical protein